MCLTSILLDVTMIPWNAAIQISGQSVVLKLDVGAEVTAITCQQISKALYWPWHT